MISSRFAVGPTLERYQARVQQAPSPSWHAVIVDDVPSGWASPDVAELLHTEGLCPDDPHPFSHNNPTPVQLPANNEHLLRVARTLLRMGKLNGWRDEALDILNPQDHALACIERAAMRPLGFRTRAVHLHAIAPDGRLWVARRAEHKSTDPGMWDTLVGGLIGAGESPYVALLRESAEEAGLEPAELAEAEPLVRFDVKREVPEGYQHETTQVWTCHLPASRQPHNCDGEIAEIALASTAEVLQGIHDGTFTTEAALSILHWMNACGGAPAVERGAGVVAQR